MTPKEQQVLESLHPKLRAAIEQVLQHTNAKGKLPPNIVLHAFEGHRSPQRQRQLYRQGTTKVRFGPHNYSPSHACDLVFFVDGEPSWDTDLPYWVPGWWSEHLGLKWGGRFGDDEPGEPHEGMRMGWDPYHHELP